MQEREKVCFLIRLRFVVAGPFLRVGFLNRDCLSDRLSLTIVRDLNLTL